MELPKDTIGKYAISRLICGGNPFIYVAHSGDLVYVNQLFKAYQTHEKVVETLMLCVDLGINTFLGRADDNVVEILGKYEKAAGSKILWIAQTAPERTPIADNIKFAANNGAIACFVHGRTSDTHISEGKVDEMLQYVEAIKERGLVAGVGAHNPNTIKTVEEAGAETDFYFLTINNAGYECDNPQLASETMKSIDKPFIGFKVLGGGRTHPKDGFPFAVQGGADFIAVGMFDFQVAENVEIAKKVFHQK